MLLYPVFNFTRKGKSDQAIFYKNSKEYEYAPVAQLDRALACGAKGRRFESCRVYQSKITVEIEAYFQSLFITHTLSTWKGLESRTVLSITILQFVM